MLAWIHVMTARLRAFLRPGEMDQDFVEELETHLAMAEEDKVRQGFPRAEARRLAQLELGGLARVREAGRETRGLPWLDASWLDVKLGLRMLRKSWGLTLIGGLAMTLVIGVGATVMALFDLAFGEALPLENGEEVVAVQIWDSRAHRRLETPWPDYERWRDHLDRLVDIGAYQHLERNLVIGEGPPELVGVAQMTASGFELARVAPLMGRTFLPEDREGNVPVVVISHEVWQSRLEADPAVIGRTLRLGDTVHTVIGVMPEGFMFPVNHGFWIPFEAKGPAVLGDPPFAAVFARLAPGASLEGAEAEVRSLGLLAPLALAETEEQLQPRVVRYTFAFTGDMERGQVRWIGRVILLFVTLLLIPPCANIAILVYARTITRQEEIAARYVLGASRGRIVGQLFIEIFVLAAGAAFIALAFARFALQHFQQNATDVLNGGAPFWMDFTLSLRTVLFAFGLAAVAALIAGALPALQATRGQMEAGLRAMGSRAGLRLGNTWTVLIVAQIALALAALPSTIELAWGTLRTGMLGPGFAAEDYLTATLSLDNELGSDGVGSDGRFTDLQAELIRRAEAEPGVSGITVASAMPGSEPWAVVEVDGAPPPGENLFAPNNLVRFNHVDDVFFDVFDVPLLTGRGFNAGDLGRENAVVVVNRTFVEQVLGDLSPVGQRVRYSRRLGEEGQGSAETWYEIVGVVGDLPAHRENGTVYHVTARDQHHPAHLALRVGGDATAFAASLRKITLAVSPALVVDEVRTLDSIYRDQAVGNNIGASTLAAVTLSVLLLSAAGIYSLMAFTVGQRRREIGIRAALGAQPSRLLAGVFRRAIAQVAVGAATGILVALVVGYFLPIENMGGWNVPGVIPGAALIMVLVGVLAALGPARRSLRVDPTEALRG